MQKKIQASNSKKTSTVDDAVRLFNSGLYEEASKALENSDINDLPNEQKSTQIKAGIALRQNKIKEALDLILEFEVKYGLNTSDIINLKGIALRSNGNFNEAYALLKDGHKKYPKAIDIAHNLSLTAGDLSKYDEAIEAAQAVLKVDPNFIESIKNLAKIYITTRKVVDARIALDRLRDLQPESLDVLVGEGAIELINGNTAKAASIYREVLKRNPDLGVAWANLGICQKFENDYVSAKTSLEKACKLEPKQVEHIWNLSLVQLALGHFETGWRNYEIRYDSRRIATDRVILPVTQVPMLAKGDNVKNKSIVLLQEQGFGDTFQFLRYSKELKLEGAREIIAIVGKELIDVIKTIPWIDRVQYQMIGEKLPDYWIFPMSLPNRYGIKDPKESPKPVPYISAEKSRENHWKARLANADPNKLKVGLVWAGRETHTNDKNRSMSLIQLSELKVLCGSVEFISLQKGTKENEALDAPFPMRRLGNEIENFSDTAAIIANLDLLISIDSAPLHLAGAMNAPVWALIPANFDFRWMVDRNSSPWYPSMTLFRQEKVLDWQPVMKKVITSLTAMVKEKKGYWKAKAYDEHPTLKGTSIAGLNLYLQSAYQFHIEDNIDKATPLYLEVLSIDPLNLDAIRNLAAIYRKRGNREKAGQLYERGIAQGKPDAVLNLNYARFLLESGNKTQALKHINEALQLESSSADARNLYRQITGYEYADALPRSNLISQIAQYPSEKILLSNLILFIKEGKVDLANKELLRLLSLTTPSVEYVILAAHLYQDNNEMELALECYARAIELNSSHPEIYINRGVLRAKQGNYIEAIEDVRKCIALAPDHAEAHFHLSIYLLTLGEYSEGWKEYEWRMDSRRTAAERVVKPNLSMPMWRGESLQGKRIMLMPEQGFGDSIQFIRYAQFLKEQGAIVIAAAHQPLLTIFKSCKWIDELVGEGEGVRYDYWCFTMSLPLLAKTTLQTVPQVIPYLATSKEKQKQWHQWLYPKEQPKTKPLIGLCWQGSGKFKRNQFRNIPFEALYPLLEMTEFDFIGLTREEDSKRNYEWQDGNLRNAGPLMQDFSDTAGIVHHLDLLITIDSAPAHIAGAMGKPCWIALDSVLPDFRWMLGRADNPWYPNTLLYRNTEHGGWKDTVDNIKMSLKAFKKENP